MTKEQLEKIAKYNQKLDEKISRESKSAFLSTTTSAMFGGLSLETLLIYANSETSFSKTCFSILTVLATIATGCTAYMAKNYFINISNLKRRYIDTERYELEEDLKNKGKEEKSKSI